ncbi:MULTISPECIES: DUF1016 N-terminal domain-containing protein [Halomonadaceae]|uniref:YhcG N-terminal domain-containing protein n=1 Tax=Vreelandella titanicae TaxID=664683 RepID=A0AAP9NR83_9GAMM|nr:MULTISPECIES: DUF1016 N-terminal domain-containing protein [Halomonas]QKS26198.1 hypothetical protein FX987_03995 [Halomonas titanicae]
MRITKPPSSSTCQVASFTGAVAENIEQQLSQQLTERLGKGFDIHHLRNMRQFYQSFPKRNAVRTELSWTHYRTLLL